MTACVNRKHTKKVAAVVTASLVGALSLGVAPVAAMAEEAGIDLLAVDWNDSVTITKAKDGKGGSVADPMKATFEAFSGKYLVPTEVKNDFQTTSVNTNDYAINYWNGPESIPSSVLLTSTDSTVSTSSSVTPDKYFAETAGKGTYYVSVKNKKTGEETNRIAFVLTESEKLEGVYAYVGTDASNKGIVYNGTDQATSIHFANGDGTEIADSRVTAVKWFAADGDEQTGTGRVKDAGDYMAVATIDGKDYNVRFTVEQLDLTEASIVIADSTSTPTSAADFVSKVKVNDSTLTEGTDVVVTSVEASDGSANWGVKGGYTVKLAAADNQDNVIGEATVTYANLSVDLFDASHAATTDLKYGNKDVAWTPGAPSSAALSVSLLDGESFDASKIKVANGDTIYTGDALEISYTKDGKPVDASALAQQGVYKAMVKVKANQVFGSSDWIGGCVELTITVSGTEVDANKGVAFYLDGELAGDKGSVTYDGTDQLEKVSVVVKDSDGNTMEEGTDYTLEVKKDGKAVETAIDADETHPYEITVKPLTFQVTNNATFQLTVNKVDIDWLVAKTTDMLLAADSETGKIPVSEMVDGSRVYNKFYLPYTGSAIEVPALTYEVESNGEYSYPELSADLFNVVSIKKDKKVVDEIADAGDYSVEIALTDEASKNYDLNDDEVLFNVREYGHFADVKPEKWYAAAVENAWHQKYINGLSNTNLFAPEADITRADAVVILFNMAGGQVGNKDYQYSETTGFDTGFADVNGKLYYAEALAWAHASGIANGYEGNFRPADKITREEFAALLANFAASKGEDVTADASALDKVSDAGTVSEWATGSVAWAVENGIMGNGGDVRAQDSIIRAEVAAMAVNYQPENLTGETR